MRYLEKLPNIPVQPYCTFYPIILSAQIVLAPGVTGLFGISPYQLNSNKQLAP